MPRVFFWFVGTAVCTIWFVFRDPSFDHRLLIAGSVLPLADGLLGGARALHSVTFSVALLILVMVATPGRRPIRRMLFGLPIGTLLHLVFTGAWTNTRVFWWPVAGVGFGDAPLPLVERGWWNIPMEAVGLALCWWVVRTAGLRDPARRAWFLRTGQLSLPVR